MIPSFLRPKDCYITCRDRDDGGGAQIAARISTMIFAQMKGLRYVHSPLESVAHHPPEISKDEWSRSWEDFFSLGNGETPYSEIAKLGFRIRPVRKVNRLFPRSRSIHVVAHCHRVTDRLPGAWAAIALVLRQRYQLQPKPILTGYSKDRVQVALHVRRGDVGAQGMFSERFTSDSVTLARIRKIIEILGENGVKIRLFSEGDDLDFLPYLDLGVELHLNEDIFKSFHHFVSSDVLLTAKSSLSYLGGVIGGNVCIHEEICHPTLPGWLKVEQMESRGFGDRLLELISNRT